MNPEEREALARLLPSPGEPILRNDRHDLLQEHLMREFTQEARDARDARDAPEARDARGTREAATAPGARGPAPVAGSP
ncbi:hypothetical protein SVIO_018050 [Streptomyces violaceusniger]|uniref:Uncharacterized protein n=1 Tax=Streptomyces violaceusniger TaxID=68280 RepID=A0A4D4KRA5_STRVO|nr:hypothetical protein SVIO_018050 [Streptomyces violaceusniger]